MKCELEFHIYIYERYIFSVFSEIAGHPKKKNIVNLPQNELMKASGDSVMYLDR